MGQSAPGRNNVLYSQSHFIFLLGTWLIYIFQPCIFTLGPHNVLHPQYMDENGRSKNLFFFCIVFSPHWGQCYRACIEDHNSTNTKTLSPLVKQASHASLSPQPPHFVCTRPEVRNELVPYCVKPQDSGFVCYN